ncbi:MAG: mercuric transport protein MerTP [Bacteroidetes bacterium]|nr:mercuric transport protein MerTP [Bacteroidota bacterium]HET6244125.1 mercuric transport protein MerTP [Bacteroidia bacterium]
MKTENKNSKGAVATGVLAALAASSCCIPPVVAAIAGVGGASASLSWVEPFRPYLIGLAVLAIGYAWYNHLKPKKADDCVCEIDKPKFYQTKAFLIGITLFAVVSIAFPFYSSVFYPKNQAKVIVIESSSITEVNFDIEGMTCTGCEEHIKHAVAQLPGFIDATADHRTGKFTVKFDKSKTDFEHVVTAINEIGYEIIKQEVIQN